VPFAVAQPGFIIEQVGSGYRLPVNIAFVPNPGPNPTDPLYYVTELYGSIQVVTRDGVKHQFATGLLDYNPTGPISGSGEQGLTGIAVRRDPSNPEVYELYVSMLWDNGSPPGSAVHYPKVEKITSTLGGLTLATRTVLLNMQPETQGQSHQISNISFGPDGKLYVHNGDGFDATKGQDLTSFRGKILRMNLDGTAPTDNPFYNASNGITATDYVYAYGLRNPFGGAWRASDSKHYTVENGPSVDRMSQLVAGRNYLYDGSDASMMNFAIYNWSPAAAPVNITFVQRETFGGSQFPASKMDHAFVSESGPTYAPGVQSNSKRVTEFVLDANGNRISGPTSLLDYIGSGQSTVVALAAGPDGLYFSEMYEETGASGATATGARIFRVRYVNPLALDYDIDGDVDNNDYEVWRANLGSNLLLASDGNKNAVVDAGDYVLWRKAMPAGAAAGASVASLSAAARTNDSAAAPSTPQGHIPTTISNDMTPGVSAAGAKNQMRVPASVGAIDMAMGVFRRANVASGTRRVLFAGKTAPALRNDETALLMALHKTMKGIEPPSSWLASESHYSDDSSESNVSDDLFAGLDFKLCRP
jgi:glucose/arabinose dehydrogenase